MIPNLVVFSFYLKWKAYGNESIDSPAQYSNNMRIVFRFFFAWSECFNHKWQNFPAIKWRKQFNKQKILINLKKKVKEERKQLFTDMSIT